MKIHADIYRAAATEHASLARELYSGARYVYAIYVAGVSVECELRAELAGEEFDAKHDLRELLAQSRYLEKLPPKDAVEVSAALGQLWMRWRNTHRYLSAAALKRFLLDRRLQVGIKGDFLKEAARVSVDSALIIVGHGVGPWMKRSSRR